jgi:hypothetical protein
MKKIAEKYGEDAPIKKAGCQNNLKGRGKERKGKISCI